MFFVVFNYTDSTEIYTFVHTLSLHDALRILASGLGGVARAGGSAAMSPLRRSASSVAGGVQDSFNAGGKVAFEATGGSSTMGSIGGATAADATSPSPDSPPAWARRTKRSQTLRHGAMPVGHAVRPGDAHGGPSSVNLSESDR